MREPSHDDPRPQPDASRLAAIVQSSDDAIVSATLDGVITSWNPAAERLFGWTAREAIGRPVTLIIPEGRRTEEDEALALVGGGDRLEPFETVRVARDGGLVDVSLTMSPVLDAAGRIVGVSRIARDIRERRREEIDRNRLAAIVDSSDDAIVSKTLDGTITSWNRAAEHLFGWTAPEAIGRHITLIIPEDRRAEEEEVMARLRRGERLDHFETARIAKDGRLLDVSLTVSPVRDAAGRIVGASKIARDISERRRMEDYRSRLLAREQQARAAAEALNHAKDEFLATASHELRTPLNAIFGWARLLESADLDETARQRAVAAIVNSAAAQERLVEDLLDLSRVVTGRLRVDVMPVDLRNVVDAALETARPAAMAKDVALVATVGDVGSLHGAADRLQQVVWNLVTNAVKFTPRGGRVDVVVRRAGDYAELVVADSGEGISPDVLPHVFDEFCQEDSSPTRAHGGLGLGLTLVKRLVELHGGHVRAESPGKGKGATFTVALPVRG